MEPRTLELIAIGAAVTANCEPCLRYHLRKGREHGLEDKEIQEAIRVARLVGKGAQANLDQVVGSLAVASRSAPDEDGEAPRETRAALEGRPSGPCCG